MVKIKVIKNRKEIIDEFIIESQTDLELILPLASRLAKLHEAAVYLLLPFNKVNILKKTIYFDIYKKYNISEIDICKMYTEITSKWPARPAGDHRNKMTVVGGDTLASRVCMKWPANQRKNVRLGPRE
jgi:hypothetical protein